MWCQQTRAPFQVTVAAWGLQSFIRFVHIFTAPLWARHFSNFPGASSVGGGDAPAVPLASGWAVGLTLASGM